MNARARAIGASGLLRIDSGFRPLPLVDALARQGYRCHVSETEAGRFETFVAPPAGPLHRYFSDDHRRLDELLRRSLAGTGAVDLVPFGAFRAGLLRHIGMEEKALFTAARGARGGEAVPITDRLRVDHGAITALLVPTPTRAIVAEILSVLGPHNRREEEPGGVYDACDRALGRAAAERLVRSCVRSPSRRSSPTTTCRRP